MPPPTTPRRRLALAALALLAGAPLLLGGCASLGDLAKAAVQPPVLTYRSAEVTALDFDGATLAFDFRLQNPNPFGLSLAGVQYWLQLEQRVVVRGTVPGGLEIPASGEAPVRFTARLPFAEVPHLLELVAKGGQVAYTVGGQVDVETPVGVLAIPASHAGQVALPALPAIRLASATVRLASLTEVDLALTLAVDNRNPFPLPEGELKFAVSLGGEVVATVDGEALAEVPAQREGRVVIPVRLSLLGAGRALATAVRGGSADLRLSGEAKIGALPVPLDLRGKASGR
jgi:LEA14-like dessication related protein